MSKNTPKKNLETRRSGVPSTQVSFKEPKIRRRDHQPVFTEQDEMESLSDFTVINKKPNFPKAKRTINFSKNPEVPGPNLYNPKQKSSFPSYSFPKSTKRYQHCVPYSPGPVYHPKFTRVSKH